MMEGTGQDQCMEMEDGVNLQTNTKTKSVKEFKMSTDDVRLSCLRSDWSQTIATFLQLT